jgi:hypothetical protein
MPHFTIPSPNLREDGPVCAPLSSSRVGRSTLYRPLNGELIMEALSGEPATEGGCRCLQPPFVYTQFDSTYLGVDPQNGRYADVSMDVCRACGRNWLHYHFELEWQSRSGRWYRGLVASEVARGVSALNAASVLEELPWYFAGGSYFGGNVHRASGRLID